MPLVSAVNVSPRAGVPLMVGTPVGALFSLVTVPVASEVRLSKVPPPSV